MRVIDYINGAEPEEVIAFYASNYQRDDWTTPEAFRRFRMALNSRIGVARNDGMRVVLRHVEDYIDVGGVSDEGENWSLSFTPWGEWKLLPVEDASGKGLSHPEIAAHLYYEITWFGWEEEGQEKLSDLLDQVEQIDRGIAKVTPFALAAAASGGDVQQAPGEAPQSGPKGQRPEPHRGQT